MTYLAYGFLVGRNIKQLEDEVGVMLFQRDNRSVKLTREGVAFNRTCQ